MSVPRVGDAPPILLDTHVFLWWADGEIARVPRNARVAIESAPAVFVSIASAWELSIKAALDKMRLRVTFKYALAVNQFAPLPIALEHVDQVATLPLHHRDPFDRLLIAQAMHEKLTLVTHDRAFGDYDVPLIWA